MPESAPVIYEVGKFYRVPTVHGEWNGMITNWPILGPWHEDKELVPHFTDYHYHFDFRFMNREEWARHRHDKPHGAVLWHAPERERYSGSSVHLGPIVMRRRKCHREMPTFPIDYLRGEHPLPLVYQKHKADSLGANMQCPHRGVSLESIKPICGVIVCPLHGLCFDSETKKVIDPKLAVERMGDQRILGSSLK